MLFVYVIFNACSHSYLLLSYLFVTELIFQRGEMMFLARDIALFCQLSALSLWSSNYVPFFSSPHVGEVRCYCLTYNQLSLGKKEKSLTYETCRRRHLLLKKISFANIPFVISTKRYSL